MELVYVIVFALAVAAFVTQPFWGKRGGSSAENPELAALEAARDSKYREIKDAETDLVSGKMTQEDFDEVDADLRRDAVEILEKLDRVKGEADDPSAETGRKPSEPDAS